LQRDRAQNHPFARHQGAEEGGATLEADFQRTHVRHRVALVELLEAEAVADFLGDAYVQRVGIDDRVDLQRQRRHARIAKKDGVHHGIVTRDLEAYYRSSRDLILRRVS